MKKDKLYGYDVQKIERVNVDNIMAEKCDEDTFMTGEFYDILGEEKKKKKGKKKSHLFAVLILFLIVFGIGGLGFLAYIKVYFTAEKYLDNIIEHYNTYIDTLNTSVELPNDFNNGYLVTGEYKFTSNMPIYENLNTLSFVYDTYQDFSKEKAYYDLSLENDNTSLLSGEVYIDKSNIYYNIPDFLPKAILVNTKDNLFTLDAESFNIYEFFKIPSYILEALKEADKKTINKGLTNIYRYEINDANKDEVLNKFKTLMLNNDLFSWFNSLYEENYLDNISIENFTLEIEVNVITKDLVSFSFIGYDETITGKWESNNKFRITDSANDYVDIDIYEDRCNITFTSEGSNYGQINTTYNDKEININIIADDVTYEIKITEDNDNSSNFYLNMAYLETSITLNLNQTINKDNINTSGYFNIKYSGATLGIDFNNTTKFDVEVPIKIYDDAINAANLSEEDALLIADGLNEFINKLPDELKYLILSYATSKSEDEEVPEHTI